MRGLLVGLMFLCGCQVDVSLGQVPIGSADARVSFGLPDAMGPLDGGSGDAEVLDVIIADSGPSPMPRLLVLATPEVMCVDGYAGHEADFEAVTPTGLGLASGPVELELPTATTAVARLSGEPIFESFGVDSLILDELPPDVEAPEGWYGAVFPLTGSGPNSTERRSGTVVLDLGSGTLPTMGLVGVELGDPSGDGACFVTFDFLLSSS